jgi:hypothetical protein
MTAQGLRTRDSMMRYGFFSEQLPDRLWDTHNILSSGYRGLSPQEHLSVGHTFSTNIVKRFLIYFPLFYFFIKARRIKIISLAIFHKLTGIQTKNSKRISSNTVTFTKRLYNPTTWSNHKGSANITPVSQPIQVTLS